MRLLCVIFTALSAYGVDEAILRLELRAKSDFDRVELAPAPRLADAATCVQSQASVLAVAAPGDLPVIHYRKGYCALAGAVITGRREEFGGAAREFDAAIQTWSGRLPPTPVPTGLRVLAAVARLLPGAGPDARKALDKELAAALEQPQYTSDFMLSSKCQDLIDVGRLWRGWIAWKDGRRADAVAVFRTLPEFGWAGLASGEQAMATGHPTQAVMALGSLVALWQRPHAGLVWTLGPRPDLMDAEYKLGSAQYAAGQYREAVATLDGVVRQRPTDARLIFARGRAKEALGEAEAAGADYLLASRIALASDDTADGHLYRGIWLYRRKDYTEAENEFAAAMNSAPHPAPSADIRAWWRMAAVAGGACQASAGQLETALETVSAFFPKNDGEALVSRCRDRRASSQGAPRPPSEVR